MPTYAIKVVETSRRLRLYTVEAADEASAREMAEDGETVDEEDLNYPEVSDRSIAWCEDVVVKTSDLPTAEELSAEEPTSD